MKPLLSELFLPCSGMHSPIRANRYPLATITGAQRASGQTHSRARSHQDDADLRADRSTAYLVSCIRVRSAHGNSFVVYFVEVTASTFLLAVTLGFSRQFAFVGALWLAFLLFPPFNFVYGLQGWLATSPIYGHTLTLSNLLLVAFIN